MREETHESLRRLFEQVIDLPPGERSALLERECPPSLRSRGSRPSARRWR
jgi:hypothetical protein